MTVQGLVKRQMVRMVPPGQAPAPEAAETAGKLPTARLFQQTDTAIVIEVTCPCGRKTYLECAFAGEKTA